MSKKYLSGAEPLYLEGDGRGLLLLHGAGGGTAWDMKEFASVAHKRGYSIWLPSLPGYGTKPSDLIDVTLDDWLTEAREGAERLLKSCDTVAVVGHSVGGLLALVLAADGNNVSRVIAWAAPWRINSVLLSLLPVLTKLPIARKIIPKHVPVEVPSHIKNMGWVGYEWLPISLGFIILAAVKRLHASVNKVTCAAFIAQGTKDKVIHKSSAQDIFERIPGSDKDIYFIKGGSHALMQDSCKAHLFQRTLEFIERSDIP